MFSFFFRYIIVSANYFEVLKANCEKKEVNFEFEESDVESEEESQDDFETLETGEVVENVFANGMFLCS